ncbi:hypothetical protein GW758_04095 [Candidatus Falkowbacteria bacterium]|nr:hypothetical protein [Candidatus Falkowbacteria bacterium]NCT55105.1 hypothetical protein [Candidatus Falkowbacteria bacterium]
MKENIKGLNDRDLEILDILGFDPKKDLSSFLETNLKTADASDLHDQGIALRSVRMILKKMKPYHKVFIRKQYDSFYDDVANFSSAENVVCFLSNVFSVSTKREASASHYW